MSADRVQASGGGLRCSRALLSLSAAGYGFRQGCSCGGFGGVTTLSFGYRLLWLRTLRHIVPAQYCAASQQRGRSWLDVRRIGVERAGTSTSEHARRLGTRPPDGAPPGVGTSVR